MGSRTVFALALALAGCYGGARATRDVNAAWRGHPRAELERRWGHPVDARGDQLRWSHTLHDVELPSASASFHAEPGLVEGSVSASSGAILVSHEDVIATIDTAGRVADVQGPSLRYGPPRSLNMRWGLLFGADVGMGRLDRTPTPLPSGGAYIGGMLTPRLGLVGDVAMVNGAGGGRGHIGLSAGMGVQYWPAARLWLRAGPAAVLVTDSPVDFTGGVEAGASYAVVRLRVFVVDLRARVIAAPGATMGSIGVGVAVN